MALKKSWNETLWEIKIVKTSYVHGRGGVTHRSRKDVQWGKMHEKTLHFHLGLIPNFRHAQLISEGLHWHRASLQRLREVVVFLKCRNLKKKKKAHKVHKPSRPIQRKKTKWQKLFLGEQRQWTYMTEDLKQLHEYAWIARRKHEQKTMKIRQMTNEQGKIIFKIPK